MSFRTRFILSSLALFFLAFLIACGSTYNRPTPPPTGGFSKSNLNGTYVFSIIGSDSGGNFLELTGTLAADGNGNLTGGTFDVNNPNNGNVVPVTVGSGSTYTVTADGRGTATAKTSSGTFGFDFVLSSSAGGLITEYDTLGTGSGTLDLQSSVAQTDLAKAWVLSLTGADGGINPMSAISAFTLNGSGTMSNGIEDINDSKTALTALTLTGTVSVGTAGSPGTAQLTTQTNPATLSFDFYPIDANHLKFIETDGVAYLAGDAFPQSSSVTAATNVFTLSGLDFTGSTSVPFVAGGFLVTNGVGGISQSAEDINDAGNVTTGISFTGLYGTTLTNGRTTVTLLNFNNGSSILSGTTTFAAYPSAGGLQLLEIDGAGITGGVAFPQSSTAIASGQGYGLNLTGSNSNGEEDDIAEFTNTNGSFSGLIDSNDMGSLTADQVFTATYTPDSSNSGRGQITSSNSFNLISYVLDSSTTVILEQDSTQLGLGSFGLQSPSVKASLAARHLAVLKPKPGAKSAEKRR